MWFIYLLSLHWRKLIFFLCKQWSVGDSCLGMDLLSTFPSQHWNSAWLGPRRPCACCLGLWVSVCQFCCVWSFFLVSSIPSGPYNLSASSSERSTHPEGGGAGKDILFRTGCSKAPHFSAYCPGMDVCIAPSSCRRKLHWGWLNGTWSIGTAECHQESSCLCKLL